MTSDQVLDKFNNTREAFAYISENVLLPVGSKITHIIRKADYGIKIACFDHDIDKKEF